MIILFFACSDTTLTTKFSNATPEATIILPDSNNGGDVIEGEAVLFRAVVSDPDTSDNGLLEARWRVDSSPDPVCDYALADENGETSCTIDVDAEMTLITVEVQDPQNAIGTDDYALNVIITNPPEIELVSPSNTGEYREGMAIEFEALVSDSEDPAVDLVVSWVSDLSGDLSLDGEISELGLYTAEGGLVEGTHSITATVQDTSGKTNSDSVEIVVGPIGTPVINFVEIQDTSGIPIEEALDGQTITCAVDVSDPDDDPLDLTYQWINEQGDDVSVDTTSEEFTLDYASQNLAEAEILTCLATVSDGLSSVSDSDDIVLAGCSPFADETPYDGIDSNCDGLENLNDLDQNNVPDDNTVDYDDDDSTSARLGLECLGKTYSDGSNSVYFLICDDDQYWKNGQVFCEENGYDGLATLHSDAEFQFLSDMLNTNQGIIDPNGSNRDARGWLGFTRGPDCAPVTNTGTGFASVCGTSVSSYYWLDNGDTSWVSGSYWFPNEGSNNVEHCTQLKLNTATGEVGMWDLYCDVVNTAPHDQWSLSHTRPSICVKRN